MSRMLVAWAIPLKEELSVAGHSLLRKKSRTIVLETVDRHCKTAKDQSHKQEDKEPLRSWNRRTGEAHLAGTGQQERNRTIEEVEVEEVIVEEVVVVVEEAFELEGPVLVLVSMQFL